MWCARCRCRFWNVIILIVYFEKTLASSSTSPTTTPKWRRSSKTYSFIWGTLFLAETLSRSVIHWWCVRFCCQNGEYFAKCALQRHMPLVPLKHWVQTMQRERKRKHCKTVHVWMSWIVLITHWWQNYFEFGARIRNHSHIGIPYICSGGISCVCVCVWRKESKRMLTVALQNSQHHWQDCKFSVSHTQGCENTS